MLFEKFLQPAYEIGCPSRLGIAENTVEFAKLVVFLHSSALPMRKRPRDPAQDEKQALSDGRRTAGPQRARLHSDRDGRKNRGRDRIALGVAHGSVRQVELPHLLHTGQAKIAVKTFNE